MELLEFASRLGGLFSTLAAFLVALSIVIAVHEFGHYIVGRWSGIKADVFSIGFGPAIASRFDSHGTRWQIAALPLGGFVKFRGDDEEYDPGADRPPPARDTMNGAPLWARSATVAAGPLANFALSIVMFAALLIASGHPGAEWRVAEVTAHPAEVQLQPGDLVTHIEGGLLPPSDAPEERHRFLQSLPASDALVWQVMRDGDQVNLLAPHPFPVVIGQVLPRSAAAAAGLRAGDVITRANGQPIHAFKELRLLVSEGKGRELALEVWRDGRYNNISLLPRMTEEPLPGGGFAPSWRVGVIGQPLFIPATRPVGIVEALSASAAQVVRITSTSLSGVYHMVTGAISSCNLSGPIGIARASGDMARQGFVEYLWFVALISTAIGLLNLFPIPLLDGGHLAFHAWEAVTGHPPGPRARKHLLTFGIAAISTLMIIALGSDLFCP